MENNQYYSWGILIILLLIISIKLNKAYTLLLIKEREDYAESKVEENSEEIDDNDCEYAIAFVKETGKASVSSLQTEFRWGYNKAVKVMTELENFGVLGEARQGERFREVLK